MSDGLHRAYYVAEVIPEGDSGVTLRLDGELVGEPGQFAMVWRPGIEERPFTLVDVSPIMLTVAQVGPVSEALCALQPGDRLWLRGPVGRGFPPVGERPLLIGGGSGSAALALLSRSARDRGFDVRVVLGARTAGLLMLGWHFEALGCDVRLATDDGSAGQRGTVLDAAAPWLEGERPDTIYACGPEPMLTALARRTQDLGIPCWVSLERVMKCGIGVCGNCHCGDRLVCTDGPVFDAEEFLRACCGTPS
ncbi:MAG TPA: dihydroorotate dehydrogenase electron transfer subunit [Chloroflexi bacterium]|jgi:dihydroorotate dehydrogenase electron transfer subunit|nr:dihydroorotate dehydrogenase electron transfer subunit [Chloroflexota bacterium]